MKQNSKSYLIMLTIIMALLITVPILSCTSQAIPEVEPESPYPPTTTPAIPEATSPSIIHSPPTEPESSTPSEISTEIHRVDVVYFHRTNRCHSCTYAEEQIWYTLETYFSDELRSNTVTFQSIDVQNPDNAAIIEKCGAYTSQLFLITILDNSENIEHIEGIWEFIGDDDNFSNLVQDKITQALERAT
jgi:hypothetical protein